MTSEPTTGIDRFTRQLRTELVTTLYSQPDAPAATAHGAAAPRPRPSWRRLVVTLAVAVVAAGLTVAPSLVRGGAGGSDALAVTTLPDGRVKVDMPRDFTDPGPLAARLRPYGVNVTRQRCTPPILGRVVGTLGFGPIRFGAWQVTDDQKPHRSKVPMVERPSAERFTLILDPKNVRGMRGSGQVGWLYVFISQATPQAKPVLGPAIFRFETTTAASTRHPGPACLAGRSTTR